MSSGMGKSRFMDEFVEDCGSIGFGQDFSDGSFCWSIAVLLRFFEDDWLNVLDVILSVDWLRGKGI